MSRKAVSAIILSLLVLGTLASVFNIRTVRASGTIYIMADGSINPATAPIFTGDNITYTLTGSITADADGIVIERGNIVLNGAGYTLTGSGGSGNGTTLTNRSNVTVRNMTIKNFLYGIELSYSSDNVLSGNNITANGNGILLESSSNNNIFHNSFVNNTNHVDTAGSSNVWDVGYPSGGNYWSGYNGTDSHSGLHQNETGSDGIGDVPYVIDVNNTDRYPLMAPFGSGHDVAVTDVQTSKTVVGQGYNVSITVTVADYGAFSEAFSVTVHANTVAIYTQSINLTSGTAKTIAFSWNTTNLVYGNYSISAYAPPVPSETDTADNNFTAGVVEVTIPSDIDGDFKVGLQDLTLLANAYRCKPDDPGWNPNADIDGNGVVGLSDLTIIAQHYGQQYQESNYEWPVYRNNVNRSGYTLSPAPSTQPTSYRWKVETGGSICSSAAVVDGKLYIGAGCDPQRTVLCLDVNTGSVLWNQTVGGTMCSSPAVSYGKVYIGTKPQAIGTYGTPGVGGVYCLDANTGDILWNYTIGPGYGAMISSPIVVDSKVFIGGYCLDANTGELLWQYPNDTWWGWNSSPAVVSGKVYIGWNESNDEGNVTCLDENTGALIWDYTTDGPIWSSPAVDDSKVFVGTEERATVYCLDAATGEEIWKNTLAENVSIFSSPAVAYGNVYVGTENEGKLYCLDENTGNIKWVDETGGTIHDDSPAITDGKVYIGTGATSSVFYPGWLQCFDAYTGNLLWKSMIAPNGYVSSSAVIAYGMIFIGGDTSILAFGTPTSLYT